MNSAEWLRRGRLLISRSCLREHYHALNQAAIPLIPLFRFPEPLLSAVASEAGKEITWWSEPAEFGIVYCDNSAIEHVTTNLVDNAVRYGKGHVEVRLTRNPTHFFIRVWDDGPGISPQYLPHLFDRGWTPEVARRDEKTSSGLGLHIARTLATRFGGDLTVESVAEPEADHHTAFLTSLPLGQAEVTHE